MRYRRMPIEIESPEELGYGTIRFNLSESSYTDAALAGLGTGLKDLLLCYGDHRGLPRLRELIAQDAGLSPSEVLVVPGAAAALFITATALLEKSDRVVVLKPNYATNLETPRALGCELVELPLRFEEGWRLDLDRLKTLLTPRTKLVSLTYPHNPTGMMIDQKTLKSIISLVEQSHARLLLDETYRDMSFPKALPSAARLSKKAISVSSLSKSYGLPGIRIGWLLCRDRSLMESFLAAKEQIVITGSVVDETIASRFLERKERELSLIRKDLLSRLKTVKAWMSEQGHFEWIEPQGGCIAFPRFKAPKAYDLPLFYKTLYKNRGAYVGPGHWFGLPDSYFRLGYGWPDKKSLAAGLKALSSAAEDSRR